MPENKRKRSAFREGWGFALLFCPVYLVLIWLAYDDLASKHAIPHYAATVTSDLQVPSLSLILTVLLGGIAYFRPNRLVLFAILGIAAFNLLFPLVQLFIFMATFD